MEEKSAGRKPRDQILYTLYDANEQVIATGTAGQIAAGLRIQVDTFHSLVHRIRFGTCRKNVIYIERYRWNQDPNAEDSTPEAWDLYDPRGDEINEQHFDEKTRQSYDSDRERNKMDSHDRRRPDPGGTMAAALRKLGVFTF